MRCILWLILLSSINPIFCMEQEPVIPMLDLEAGKEEIERPTQEQWEKNFIVALKGNKSDALLRLLSPDGQPQTRGLKFHPYNDALAQINAHREQEEDILTNKGKPPFPCCNPTHMWNRYVKPGVVILAHAATIGANIWGIHKAVSSEQSSELALQKAAPNILALAAAVLNIPTIIKSSWLAIILKRQQSKFEYYTISREVVENQRKLLELMQAGAHLPEEDE